MNLTFNIKILIFLNGFLFLLLLFLFFGGGQEELSASHVIPNELKSLSHRNKNTSSAPTDFSILHSKAIFHKTRRNIEIKKAVIKQQVIRTVPLNNFLLKGVIFKKNGKSVIYVRNKNTQKNLKLMLGDNFEGWEVKEIFKTYIKLEKGGQLSKLDLLKK
jgi:hypothetical protein